MKKSRTEILLEEIIKDIWFREEMLIAKIVGTNAMIMAIGGAILLSIGVFIEQNIWCVVVGVSLFIMSCISSLIASKFENIVTEEWKSCRNIDVTRIMQDNKVISKKIEVKKCLT